MVYDLIIIGAGPAGLAAALDAAYLKLKVLVLEAHRAGGALVQTYPWKSVDSYLGFKDMTCIEVARKIIDHVKSAGIKIKENELVEEVHIAKPFKVKTSKVTYESKTIIIASGIRGIPRKLSVPGENLEGVHHFVKEPHKFKNKKVLVVGGGDSAVECALGLEKAEAKVWLAHRRDELRAVDENKEKILKSDVKIMWNTAVEKITGHDMVEHVTVSNNKNGKKTELVIEHVFICIGSISSRDCLERIGIKMDHICVEVDKDGMTTVPGIFAAGDIVSKIKRIPQALATGERAVYSAYKYIKNPYWK